MIGQSVDLWSISKQERCQVQDGHRYAQMPIRRPLTPYDLYNVIHPYMPYLILSPAIIRNVHLSPFFRLISLPQINDIWMHSLRTFKSLLVARAQRAGKIYVFQCQIISRANIMINPKEILTSVKRIFTKTRRRDSLC